MSSKHKKRERAEMDAIQTENAAAVNETEQAVGATQESLDKVRDILFGTQLRQQDSRQSQLEEKIGAQLAAFREETRKSLETLQDFVKGEIKGATDALATEARQRQDSLHRLQEEFKSADGALGARLDQTARTLGDESKAGFGQLADELQNKSKALEARIAAAEQHQGEADSELRGQLLEATNRLRDEGRQSQGQLQTTIEKVVAELRSAKTDRTVLANLFNEMAGRLQS